HTAFVIVLFNAPAPTEIYTLSLHDALPILWRRGVPGCFTKLRPGTGRQPGGADASSAACHRHAGGWTRVAGLGELRRHYLRRLRSEEHTSELQSPCNLVCRLLLEKKKPEYN